MAYISQNEINDIQNSADIVDIISSYIPLNQKGKNYFGVCPFHEDHSPSLSVSKEKQIYKCFSCGAAGNVFTFVENFLNISFNEAIILIADKVGIAIKNDFIPQKQTKYNKEYEIMDFVMKFYQNNLNSLEGTNAIKYLNDRNLKENVQNDFNIGLALDKEILYNLLLSKGYDNNLLEDLGLINKTGNKYTEIFKNRIIFPIHNLDGKVVGFTARCYLKDITPKYLNTKETYIFKKGNILYNYHRAKDEVRLKKEVVVVEGNMDAIRLYSSGIKNVVALMGTSLTNEQIEALKKLRCKIILMLDNDNAGEVATYAVGNNLEIHGLDISVVRLSGAKDPDEYILKYNVEAMEDNIKNAISFMDFKLNYLKKNKNLDSSVDLAEYIKAVIENLKNNNDEILKEVTLQKLSNDYNISYSVLKSQLEVGNNESKKITKEEVKNTKKKSSSEKLIDEILYFMMNGEEYIKLYQTGLGMLPNKRDRAIANEILYYYDKNKTINLANFITYLENINLKTEIMDIIENVNIDEISIPAMEELLIKLNRKIKNEEIKKLKEELKEEFDVNKKIEITKRIAEIKKGSVENESY